MGEVYRAVDTVKGWAVIMKRLLPHLVADAKFQPDFGASHGWRPPRL